MANVRVKVDRLEFIAALEAKVAGNAAAVAANEKATAKVNAAKLAHAKAIIKTLKSADILDARVDTYTYRPAEIRITLASADVPPLDLAEVEFVPVLSDWEIKKIESGLRLLRLSNEQSLTLSALGDLAQYV